MRSNALMSRVERRKAGVVGRRLCDGASVVLGPDRVGRRLSDGECGDQITLQFRFSVFFKLNITNSCVAETGMEKHFIVSNLWTHALLTFISVGVCG
jgi:hypothetical protein